MHAVIIAHGFNENMPFLNEKLPTSMLPIINKPFIQHLVEHLIIQGVDHFEIINSHLPEKTETFLEDGTRWGCTITHHLAANISKAYRMLKTLNLSDVGLTLIGHGDTLPWFNPETDDKLSDMKEPTVFVPKVEPPESSLTGAAEGTGWFLVNYDTIKNLSEIHSRLDLFEHIKGNSTDPVKVKQVETFLSVQHYRDLIDSNNHVLDKSVTGLLIPAKEVNENVWLSRNVVLNPTVRIVPPVYVGEDCLVGKGVQVGPYAVIGNGCIIEENCRIQNSVIIQGSYLGVGLELNNSIVDKNRLINVEIGAEISITDDFMLGSIAQQFLRNWFYKMLSCTTAMVLFIFLLPVYILTILYLKLFRKGPLFFSQSIVKIPAKDLLGRLEPFELVTFFNPKAVKDLNQKKGFDNLLQYLILFFIPALPNVIKGNIRLVGLPPRSESDINRLSNDWRLLYLSSKAGLITEALVNYGLECNEDELYTSEAYYSVKSSLRHDFSLLFRFMRKIGSFQTKTTS